MKLNPGERSILASFRSGPDAEKAEQALRQAGYSEVQFDQIGLVGYDWSPNHDRPGFGGERSEVTAVMYGHERMLDDDVRVLLNAFPEASGVAGTTEDEFPNFLVTVVTDDAGVDEAVRIVHEHGGRV